MFKIYQPIYRIGLRLGQLIAMLRLYDSRLIDQSASGCFHYIATDLASLLREKSALQNFDKPTLKRMDMFLHELSKNTSYKLDDTRQYKPSPDVSMLQSYVATITNHISDSAEANAAFRLGYNIVFCSLNHEKWMWENTKLIQADSKLLSTELSTLFPEKRESDAVKAYPFFPEKDKHLSGWCILELGLKDLKMGEFDDNQEKRRSFDRDQQLLDLYERLGTIAKVQKEWNKMNSPKLSMDAIKKALQKARKERD